MLGILGLLIAVGGGALALHIYGNSQQEVANREYGEAIWSDEPVENIFPENIGGRESRVGTLTNPKHANWHRLGISQEKSCSDGLDGQMLKTAVKLGCEAVLRATYVDPTGNMVATVAIVVLPADKTKKLEMVDAFREVRETEPGVVAFPVPGTPGARWADARNGAAFDRPLDDHLPYAVGVTTGSVDARVAGELPGKWGEREEVEDRLSYEAEAEVLAKMFRTYLEDLQLGVGADG